MEDRHAGRYFVRIKAGSLRQLRSLSDIHHLDVFRHTAKQLSDREFSVDGLLTGEQINQISKENFQVERIADANEIARMRSEELARTRSEKEGRRETDRNGQK